MKLKFKNQDFQTHAVRSVTDLFKGQEKVKSTFHIVREDESQLSLQQNEFGVGNQLVLEDAQIIDNMNEVQRRLHLPLSDDLENMQFSIEMETGTGKTYVYTKTIFELNKLYGFTKFIIVVPSVAIREGVYKSFEITNEHFMNTYENEPYRFFIYNSAKLSDVKHFATSSNIEVMIINIDAFKKSENIINQEQDRLGGETAMRYIRDTNSVVIIDEPQSVDNTPKAKEAIASLNPLCVLRYSATHRDKMNLLYKLTPVDAYQMGLVKQISVSSNMSYGDYNTPYIKLLSVSNQNGFSAKIELDVQNKDGKASRKTITVKPSTDLFIKSGERELYEGCIIEGIDCTEGFEAIEFSNGQLLKLNKAIGNIDENMLKKAQIKRTIETHLDKELRYHKMGIKVLSLFFIDKVEKYRNINGEKGRYALMFEEIYNELMELPKYKPLKMQFVTKVENVHNGYFSQDKKGNFKDTNGDTVADYDTYETIMKDKEWLLSFDCPLRFIFSHSTLKEGWDNPNVFQVCTLIEQKSTLTARQKIGRGLRLCVNQNGERIEDKHINQLHVMANESFAEFTSTLQKEIEKETGVMFGMLQLHMFTGITYNETYEEVKKADESDVKLVIDYMKENDYITEDFKPTKKAVEQLEELPSQLEIAKKSIQKAIEEQTPIAAEEIIGENYTETITIEKAMTHEDATELLNHFEKKEYISKTGKIKDTMKNALKAGALDLPKKYEDARERFESIIISADKTPPIRDASKEVKVKLKKEVLLSDEFIALWDKIKQKTTYRVNIDTEKLIANSIKDLDSLPPIQKARIVSSTADIDIQTAGVGYEEKHIKTMDLEHSYTMLPDIINIISEETLTTPKTVSQILLGSKKINDFLFNPQAFLESSLEVIKRNRHALAIDGISYIKLDGEQYYVQEIFEIDELIATIDKNAIAVEHSVYDHVVYDSSTVEKPFAKALDNDPDVKMYFKLPSKFKIDTPLGSYNPDWAVYMESDGQHKLYFVLETKGSKSLFDLRTQKN